MPAALDVATRLRRFAPRPQWLLLLPALGLLAAAIVVPLVKSLLDSFGSPDWTGTYYARLFDDGVSMRVVARTAWTAAVVTAVTFALGYPYAYLMTRVAARMRGVLLIIVLVPFWTSVMARNYAWVLILERNGPVDRTAQLFGAHLVLYQQVGGVVVAMSQVLLPFMVLPLYSALAGIDRRLLLAARSLGSSPVRAFWRVFWPLSRAGVASGCLLVFTLSLGFYVTPALIGSPQQSLIAQLLATRTSQLLDFAGAGALGMLVLGATLLLVTWANRFGSTVSALGVPSVGSAGRRS